MLSVKLIVVGGDAKNKEVQLKLPTIIGRGKEGVSLTLPHKLVSRKHTELFEQDGKLYVKDLGSLNGTYVNNKRIIQRTLLNPNELLTLGNVTFRAIYDVAGVAAAPEVPEFQEVEATEEVLEEPVSDSGTDKSLLGIAAEIAAEEVSDVVEAAAEEPAAPEQPAPEPVAQLEAVAESSLLDGSSDIFDGPAIEGASPEKSISMSAIDGLPAVSKNAEFEVQLDGLKQAEAVEQIEIDLDEPTAPASADDSRLGSFLKKMPR